MRRSTALIMAAILVSATSPLAQKVTSVSFEASGVKRAYYVFVPDKAREAPAPLLVLLHGSGRDGTPR